MQPREATSVKRKPGTAPPPPSPASTLRSGSSWSCSWSTFRSTSTSCSDASRHSSTPQSST